MSEGWKTIALAKEPRPGTLCWTMHAWFDAESGVGGWGAIRRVQRSREVRFWVNEAEWSLEFAIVIRNLRLEWIWRLFVIFLKFFYFVHFMG